MEKHWESSKCCACVLFSIAFACWNGKKVRTASTAFLPFAEHQQSQKPHADNKADFRSFTSGNGQNHTLHYITLNHDAMHHNAMFNCYDSPSSHHHQHHPFSLKTFSLLNFPLKYWTLFIRLSLAECFYLSSYYSRFH